MSCDCGKPTNHCDPCAKLGPSFNEIMYAAERVVKIVEEGKAATESEYYARLKGYTEYWRDWLERNTTTYG